MVATVADDALRYWGRIEVVLETTRTCPRCAAAVAAHVVRCPECGYPLGWRDGPDDQTDPLASDAIRGRGGVAADEETVERPFDAVRRRRESSAGDEETHPVGPLPPSAGDEVTHPVGPLPPSTGDEQTRPVGPLPPSTGDEQTHPVGPPPPGAGRPAGTGDVAPPVWCPTCGAANLAGRTLCERCGMGLATETVAVRDGRRWWRGRVARFLLLAIVVIGGAFAGLRMFGDLSADDPVAEGDGGPAAADPSEAPAVTPSEPTVVLEPGASGPEVEQWQQLLLAAGLDVGVDGQFGPGTEQSTAQFQRTIGEEPTGRVTTRTMAAAQNGPSLRRVRIFLLRDGELDGVRRLVDVTQLARGALEMLIAGPLQIERDDGLSTAIPPGTMLRSVRVDAGTADVTLTGFAADPDESSLRQRVEQVVATMTRFDSVDAVRFQLPPDEAMVFADAGVVLTEARGGDG